MGGTISATLRGADGYSATLGGAALLPANFSLPGVAFRTTVFALEQVRELFGRVARAGRIADSP